MDISREIDLIEEVIRLYGFDRVPVTLPQVSVTEMKMIPRLELEERLRKLLVGSGFTEVINYSFGTPLAVDHLSLPENDERRHGVKIKNPLSEELSVMRTTMIHGLLETARKNANNGSFDLKLIEMGRIFVHRQAGELPSEKNIIAGLMTGKISDDFWSADKIADFYTLKGCVENIFHDLKIHPCRYIAENNEPFLHPGKSCTIICHDRTLGFLGEIHPDVRETMGLKNNVYVFEMDLDRLSAVYDEIEIRYHDISKFPSVARDAAFVVPDSMEADKLLDVIRKQQEYLLENVIIFDVYKGNGIPEGTKSLGLRFSYRAIDRTLTDTEASTIHERIVRTTVDLTGAHIRS